MLDWTPENNHRYFTALFFVLFFNLGVEENKLGAVSRLLLSADLTFYCTCAIKSEPFP